MNREEVIKKGSSKKTQPHKRELLRRTTRELSALLAVAEVATQSLNAQKVLNDTLDKSLEILGFKLGYIRILDSEAGGLVIRIARGLSSPEFLANIVRLDSPHRSVGKIIFETREPVISSDIRQDLRFQHGFMAREGLISAAFVPIISKNRVLGLMMVGSSKLHKFSKGEINLLRVFGSQLGAALENAQLYDEVSKGKNIHREPRRKCRRPDYFTTELEDRILTWNRGAEAFFGY